MFEFDGISGPELIVGDGAVWRDQADSTIADSDHFIQFVLAAVAVIQTIQARKDARNSRSRITQLMKEALAAMNPEAIADLQKGFLPNILAAGNPIFQQQIQDLRSTQGQRGLLESGFGLAQEQGLRGTQANAAVQQSFEQAISQGRANANVIAGFGPLQASVGNGPNFTQNLQGISNAFGSGGGLANAIGAAGINTNRQLGIAPQGSFGQQFPPSGQFQSGFGVPQVPTPRNPFSVTR